MRPSVLLAWLAAAALLTLGSPAAAAAFGAYRPAPTYDEEVVTSFYLPLRDGTRIAVSLHRPSRDGKAVEARLPVIWHNTLAIDAAGTGEPAPGLASLTRQGYVVAVVARRGNGASFGTRRGYEDFTEGFDAYEVTEWLAAQPWSDGKVGMFGCSNTGEAVMHAIAARPPHLAAAWAGCFAWDRFDGHTRGGIIAQFGTGPSRTVEQDLQTNPVQGDEAKTLLRQAAEEHQLSTNLLELMKGMPYRDSYSTLVMSRFWYEVSLGAVADQVKLANVPLYIQGGWRDDFRTQGLVTMANLPGTRMLIGPWRHCRNEGFDLQSEQLRFFDDHLKGIDTGLAADAPLHYFTMQGPKDGVWKSTRQWPLPGAKATPVFLDGGKLADRAGKTATTFTVTYDTPCPAEPVGAFSVSCHPVGGVSFIQAPLKADTEVTGHPIADLWITSSAPDANLFVLLEDVAPDGTVTVVTDGRQKASLRKLNPSPWPLLGLPWHRSWKEDAADLKAGEPAQVTFDLLAASYVFKAGHRIQITVAGADYRERAQPRFMPAPTLTVLAKSSVSLPVVR
ncbi:CocE/NonD family hydrolase [soil metagenome]